MSVCTKCGAELFENAIFCAKCGSPVVPPTTGSERPKEERITRWILPIVMVVVLIIALILVNLVLIPWQPVSIEEHREVSYQEGVEFINLDFSADVAQIDISFDDLNDKFIHLDVIATGGEGIFGSTDEFNLTFDDDISGNILTVSSELETGRGWHSVKVTCDIVIDNSLNTSLDIKSITGGVKFTSRTDVVLETINLEATTGEVELNLVKDVVLTDDISLETTTGNTELIWDNVNVTKDILVDIKTTTGEVNVNIKQHEELQGDISVDVEVTTGGIDFSIDIKDDIGAKISSGTTTGGIDIKRQIGFSGTESLLQSDNYPAGHNYNINLETTTGGIDIVAEHTA